MYLLIICIIFITIICLIYINYPSSSAMFMDKSPFTPQIGRTNCPGGGPLGQIPILPIPGGVVLDLSSTSAMQKTKMSFQAVESSINASDGILTIIMQPNEKDNNLASPKSDRRRNEISIRDPSFCLKLGSTGTWGCQVRVNENLSWGSNFYHIMQVKSQELNTNPYFTISIRNNQIQVMDYTGINYTPIQPLCSVIHNWIPISVTVTNKPGTIISYNVNGKTGTLAMPSSANSELYFKCGQYRKIIPTGDVTFPTSSSYKDISFKLT